MSELKSITQGSFMSFAIVVLILASERFPTLKKVEAPMWKQRSGLEASLERRPGSGTALSPPSSFFWGIYAFQVWPSSLTTWGRTRKVFWWGPRENITSSLILGWLWLLGVIWGGAPFCSWKSILSLINHQRRTIAGVCGALHLCRVDLSRAQMTRQAKIR